MKIVKNPIARDERLMRRAITRAVIRVCDQITEEVDCEKLYEKLCDDPELCGIKISAFKDMALRSALERVLSSRDSPPPLDYTVGDTIGLWFPEQCERQIIRLDDDKVVAFPYATRQHNLVRKAHVVENWEIIRAAHDVDMSRFKLLEHAYTHGDDVHYNRQAIKWFIDHPEQMTLAIEP